MVKSGRVLSSACNIDKNNPNILEEEKIRWHSSVCAERRALKACADPRGAVIIVVRLRPNGETAYSKPCARCVMVCKAAGIKRIVYSD